ncbi:MAG: NUDIX hydrolase [Bacteroidetes bacterium]|nr:NUDIX hydrolase [Bacteroidota bacterium]
MKKSAPRYTHEHRYLVAIDCIIFGFDGSEIRLLLVHRGFEPEKGKWSLMGGFLQPKESLEDAANRILQQLTGLKGVYMEQLSVFSDPRRDPVERTLSVAFYALIDIHRYEKQLSENFHPEWFSLNEVPALVFDHNHMVELARQKLMQRASSEPVLFELLPDRFTLPQVQALYESLYGRKFDKRNFSRKMLSSSLLIRQKEKERTQSKKGAYFHTLNRRNHDRTQRIIPPLTL